MVLSDAEIFSLVDSGAGASDQNDVVRARNATIPLSRSPDRERAVGVADRSQMRILVLIGGSQPAHEFVVGRGAPLGIALAHDIHVLRGVVAKPDDGRAGLVVSSRADHRVMSPLQGAPANSSSNLVPSPGT